MLLQMYIQRREMGQKAEGGAHQLWKDYSKCSDEQNIDA